MDQRDRLTPYAFIAPALLSTAVVTLMPTLYTIYLSFTNWSLYHFDKPSFIGLANYREILAGCCAPTA